MVEEECKYANSKEKEWSLCNLYKKGKIDGIKLEDSYRINVCEKNGGKFDDGTFCPLKDKINIAIVPWKEKLEEGFKNFINHANQIMGIEQTIGEVKK